ncbi:MAG: hypothetical protein PVJ39_18755 [Gammaproteobacteria bacterium]|jgi:hypothetical protein
MSQLVLHPTSTAQWHSLVCEAEGLARVYLDEELQSYLVFLLMRFSSKPDIAARVLALDYIDSLLSTGRNQQDKLRDVGDVCLIHAGFFPRRARRKRVSEQYFVDLGSGAYRHLSAVLETGGARLYQRLYESFLPIRDLLRAMRSVNQPGEPDTSAPGTGDHPMVIADKSSYREIETPPLPRFKH